MALAMSRPWKHPKTGVYYVRKRVPADLREAVGAEIVKITLQTKDPAVAKSLHIKALGDLESRWANMRRGEQTLTEREAHSIANREYEVWIRMHRNDPSMQRFWRTDLYDQIWTTPFIEVTEENIRRFGPEKQMDSFFITEMRRFCRKTSAGILLKNGLLLDEASSSKLERAIAAAFQRASLELLRMSEGHDQEKDVKFLQNISKSHYEQQLLIGKKTSTEHWPRQSTPKSPVTMGRLLDEWWQESKAAGRKPSTYESYRNTVKYFVRYLGHDDAGSVSAEDVVGFKNHRLTTPSAKTGRVPSAKTVKDSDLSALKTLFGWGVANKRFGDNPTIGITIKVAKAPRLRGKGFTDAEAEAILSAARRYENPNERPETAAAKRWVPLLCAFTGARVGEIAQLRRQDVRSVGDRWVIRITPEAGTVKTNEAREVVLHRQVVSLGFTSFVEASAEGPLFLRMANDGSVLGPLRGLKNRLAEFARAIVPDPNVAPNHGWRHRFKTIGMEAGIAPRILDAIQGQAARTVADTYGEVTVKTIAVSIDRLPLYDLFNQTSGS